MRPYFLFLVIYFIHFWLHWSLLLCEDSLVVVMVVYSTCGAWASHRGGFSRGAQAPGAQAPAVAHSVAQSHSAQHTVAQSQELQCTGLVALRHVEPSRTRNQPMSPPLAGGFLSTVPPAKSETLCFRCIYPTPNI